MGAMMKIGELAKRTACQVETIRYYEQEGLLPEPARSEGNFRLYNDAHVERLQFIRNCRSLDMTLDEIRSLLSFRDAPEQDCGEVNTLLDTQSGRYPSDPQKEMPSQGVARREPVDRALPGPRLQYKEPTMVASFNCSSMNTRLGIIGTSSSVRMQECLNVVKRAINRPKDFHAIATGHDKRGHDCLGALQ